MEGSEAEWIFIECHHRKILVHLTENIILKVGGKNEQYKFGNFRSYFRHST